jgi:acetylornithine deacetylase
MPELNPTHARLIEHARRLEPETVALTSALVRIPTVNPYSCDHSAASELPGQQALQDVFKRIGFETRFSEIPEDIYQRAGCIGPQGRSWKNRPNLIGTLKLGSGKGKTVVLNNHMDTVGTAGMQIDPFSGKVEDGKIWGRGTSDTKGSTCAGVSGVRALLESGAAGECDGTIIFESVVDEECNGGGSGTMWACLEGLRGDYAICLDGVGPAPFHGCNGILTYDIIVAGLSGHSSGTKSVNAIDKAIVIKNAIDDFKRLRYAQGKSLHVSIGVMRAGHIAAVVPNEALIGVNVNYDVNEAEQGLRATKRWGGSIVEQQFFDHLNRAAAADEFLRDHPLKFEVVKDVYGFTTPPEHELIQTAIAATSTVLEKPVQITRMEAWCDASHLNRIGKMPTVGMGSGTPGVSHGAVEHCEIARLTNGSAAVAVALYELLKVNR